MGLWAWWQKMMGGSRGGGAGAIREGTRSEVAAPRLSRVATSEEYRQWKKSMAVELQRRRDEEKSLAAGHEDEFFVPGHCHVCDEDVAFKVDYSYSYPVDGVLLPNWREHLKCPTCTLNNRMRATIHLFHLLLQPDPEARIYLTEQLTSLYRWFGDRYEHVVGSEYLGDAVPWGETNEQGVRNESMTRMTFDRDSFDYVISLDVCEHIPEYLKALEECHRVLKPGGQLLFTVPFDPDRESNLVRAVVGNDGEIEHLEEPEYHGDPLTTEGCLAFYKFGWSLLDDVRQVGFRDVSARFYWSRHFGYLGSDLVVFLATKDTSEAVS